MDEEPASEAIDGDVDSNDDSPDSMDLLMGEIEIPYENNFCDNILEKKLSPKLKKSPFYNFPVVEEEKNESITTDCYPSIETPPVNINSLKICQGYISQSSTTEDQTTSKGFIRSGELLRTTIGSEPIFVPKEVLN